MIYQMQRHSGDCELDIDDNPDLVHTESGIEVQCWYLVRAEDIQEQQNADKDS